MALPAAVLTNFSATTVYDARIEPMPSDGPHVARLPEAVFGWEEYIDRFSEIWDYLSYESVASEQYYVIYEYAEEPRGSSPVDRQFLRQLRGWRLKLARDIASNHPEYGVDEIGRVTQRILNALLFLRICEDREIEPYRSLASALEHGRFQQRLREADQTYNAGLFEVLDDIAISDDVLRTVIEDLYWPRSRYAFGVMEPEILAAVYEHFLGERIASDAKRNVVLETKPELLHHGGVVATPDWVVNRLVGMCLDSLPVADLLIKDAELRILDPACGSGSFLLAAYREVMRKYEPGKEKLELAARGRIAAEHLFGVDIDPEAVEVTRLSLLVAVLGDERIDPHVVKSVLPDLRNNIQVGNSLIDSTFDSLFPSIAADTGRRAAVRPLDWKAAFPAIFGTRSGGFDAVVGNPPYARIQVLAEHLPDQLTFFQSPQSGYVSSQQFNFDEYMLFVERAIELLQPGGVLANILPHRFMTSVAGKSLRRLLLNQTTIERIVHFGHSQVFPGRSTYTCLILMRKDGP